MLSVSNAEKTETIDLFLEDELFMDLALEAHNKNITLNDLIVEILQGIIDEHEGINEGSSIKVDESRDQE